MRLVIAGIVTLAILIMVCAFRKKNEGNASILTIENNILHINHVAKTNMQMCLQSWKWIHPSSLSKAEFPSIPIPFRP